MNKFIERLREKISLYNLSGYLVPTTDEFQSEYPPEATKRLELITGFSSSNAFVIVTLKDIIFFTDSRYLESAKEYFGFDAYVFNYNLLKDFDYSKFIKPGDKIGYNSKLFSNKVMALFSKVTLVQTEDLVDLIWDNKPLLKTGQVFEYDTKYAGFSRLDKINKLKSTLQNIGTEGILLTSSESICWLLNLRSDDSSYSPIMLAYLYLDFEKIILFTTDRKIPQLNDVDLEVRNFEEFDEFLHSIKNKILVPEDSSNYIHKTLSNTAVFLADPTALMRAIKHKNEIENAKKIHIEDAIALIEFFAWFQEEGGGLDEFEIGIKLSEFRSNRPSYKIDSFAPIVGFDSNSSKIHYKASKLSPKIISGNGLLLIDSGGHYFGGTTDVTRTILIGAAKQEWKDNYTKVLKGHIALATIVFPENTRGANLDVLARKYLWLSGDDYGHGTGHGVGNFLSVHEGPASISLYSTKYSLYEGMILSNEPGYYKEGSFGIRIENLQFIKKSPHQNFLEFEQLTMVPYCSDLIDKSKLFSEEILYLKNYYSNINEKVTPFLSERAKKLLQKELSFIDDISI